MYQEKAELSEKKICPLDYYGEASCNKFLERTDTEW